MTMRTRSLLPLSLALLAIGLGFAAHAQEAAPAMQLPPDQQALHAAIASPTVDAQIAGLESFLHDFPDSKRAGYARSKLFRLLLGAHPDRTRLIHSLAKQQVESAPSGLPRSYEENNVAFQLAEAPPNGVDLKSAEKWANDSVDQVTLPALTAQMKVSSEKFKFPMPSAAEIQDQYANSLTADLQTLADVYFHEGKLDKATATLDRTKAFDQAKIQENLGSILLTRGQIAAAQHHDAEALDDLERAAVYGGITAQTKPLLVSLYTQSHDGSADGLESALDALYHQLVPPAITPVPRNLPPTGRTVLVELFTGSACSPCVAADVAVEGLLNAYPRSEVVALSFDQHIPEPDPLANPDSISRADFYGVRSTPTILLDGQQGVFVGGDRSEAPKGFPKLEDAIDKQLKTPSGVDLRLDAKLSPGHAVVVDATVNITDPATFAKLLAPAAGKASAAPVNAVVAAPPSNAVSAPPHLVLNFALVQQDVRYSGENGIRFHSMVVRALARPSATAFPVALTGESHASFTFDPATISQDLGKYLASFSQHNDRFGVVHFLSTDTTIAGPLAVAAWVEDPSNHHVVAAAFVPLAPVPLASASEQAAR